jgi:MoxR-like ATPase
VIATQNPVEFSGTFPLPEAQLDRFFMRLSLGYPDEAQEIDIMMGQLQGHPLDKLKPLFNEATLSVLQKQAEKVTISEPMVRYISQIVRETRIQPGVRLGVSPRGSLALMRAARAMAMLKGKTSVTPDIIPSLLEPILGHRIVFRDSSLNQADSRKEFWNKIITSVAIPDFPEAEESGYY